MARLLTIQEVINILESEFPLQLQESWDNCGLQIGNTNDIVTGILTTLDVTPEVIDEAIEKKANLIVSHHPFLFKGIKSINFNMGIGKQIERLVRNGISVYSAHTNLDIAKGGLNDYVANQCGLKNVRGLVETSRDTYFKLQVFVPLSHSDVVRKALAKSGAGQIGQYRACSFSLQGEGRFEPLDGATPFIGEVDSLAVVKEERIEVIISASEIHTAIQMMKEVHPYEEVAYDVIELKNDLQVHYLGRIGELEKPMELSFWAEGVKEIFTGPKGQYQVRFGGAKKDVIHRIAICTGSGAEFIKMAAKHKADVYITGDVKYHDMQLAKELGLLVVDGGHFGTEWMAPTILRETIETGLTKEGVKDIFAVESHAQDDFFFKI